METTHTPTPWKVDERNGCIAIYEASEDYNCLDIPHKYFIAYFSGYSDDVNQWQVHDKDKANAAFIVEACNNYDRIAELEKVNAALVAALEEMRDAFEEYINQFGAVHYGNCPEDDTCNCDGHVINDKVGAAFNKSYAAIALAKGEK